MVSFMHAGGAPLAEQTPAGLNTQKSCTSFAAPAKAGSQQKCIVDLDQIGSVAEQPVGTNLRLGI